MNKGKKLVVCEECGKKRFCTRKGTTLEGKHYTVITCSKGHTWQFRTLNIELANQVLQAIYLPAVREMMNSNSVLYTRLMRG